MRTTKNSWRLAALALALLPAAAAAQEAKTKEAAKPAEPPPTFAQVPLPFAEDALSPYIGKETVQYHYGRHYKANVDTLNKLVAGKPEAARTLEQIILSAPPGPLFNNAAQVWNHSFYFRGLKPGGGGEPAGALAEAIKRDFGTFAAFRDAYAQAAQGLFGSGWAWLVLDGGKLKIVRTTNADLPLVHGQWALLVIDVWEHAYYLDYRNQRPLYVGALLDHLVNWDFAAENYAAGLKAAASASIGK